MRNPQDTKAAFGSPFVGFFGRGSAMLPVQQAGQPTCSTTCLLSAVLTGLCATSEPRRGDGMMAGGEMQWNPCRKKGNILRWAVFCFVIQIKSVLLQRKTRMMIYHKTTKTMQNSNQVECGSATALPPERSRLATFHAEILFCGFCRFCEK